MSEKVLNKLCTKFIPVCLLLGQAAPTMFLLIIFSLWTLLCLFTMEGNLDFFSNHLLCISAFDCWSYTELSKILTWKCNSIKLWGHRSGLTTYHLLSIEFTEVHLYWWYFRDKGNESHQYVVFYIACKSICHDSSCSKAKGWSWEISGARAAHLPPLL